MGDILSSGRFQYFVLRCVQMLSIAAARSTNTSSVAVPRSLSTVSPSAAQTDQVLLSPGATSKGCRAASAVAGGAVGGVGLGVAGVYGGVYAGVLASSLM